MNKVITILITLLVLVVIGFGAYYIGTKTNTPAINSTNNTDNTAQTTPAPQTKGTVYFTVTDAAVNMGTINAINVTIDKVELHSATEGWVTVTQTPQTFSLLDLKKKAQAQLLGQADVTTQTYDQIKLHVTKILVTENGAVKEAKLPSDELKINTNIQVGANAITVTRLDIVADASLHKTGKGEFIFSPVMKIDTTNDTLVRVDSGNIIVISGGNASQTVNVGMDVDGTVKTNFILDPKTDLNINGGKVEVVGRIVLP